MYKYISFENIKYCVGHHAGGYYNDPNASTQHETAEDIDSWHKIRWPNFKSSLGYWGGYNFYIEKLGKIIQFRAIGEETAAQLGHNKDSVSICLAGNFTKGIDMLTPEQIKSLKELIDWLIDMGIKLQDIVPHRFLQMTECYGSALSDDWARNLGKEKVIEKISLLQKLLNLYIIWLDLLKKSKVRFGGQSPISAGPYKFTDDPFLGKG